MAVVAGLSALLVQALAVAAGLRTSLLAPARPLPQAALAVLLVLAPVEALVAALGRPHQDSAEAARGRLLLGS